MAVAGIDVGSVSVKAVLLDDKAQVLSHHVVRSSAKPEEVAIGILESVLEKANLERSDVEYVIATGYGRQRVTFRNEDFSEITCHAQGAYHLFPQVRTIIDIGGQDSKVIGLNDRGQVAKFVMNDKCAAGTGRFVEVMAQALQVPLADMGKLSLAAQREVQVSSMCTVFAESEVISLIATGHTTEDIIAGINESIARRIDSMARRVGIVEAVVNSGGVARNIGVVKALEAHLGVKLLVPFEPQVVGALGAAILALKHCGYEIPAKATDAVSA